ncbi:visual pigment-like receptor peropsin [Ylistrum balloti]|uniref:visual pigment-like receptor peropsin n=1 Tax=Ylistrum balloti TaxID=509963 RepID=UPI002905C29D|nr:visual pigment-like receptor peropsin [Ylistrum balloti]
MASSNVTTSNVGFTKPVNVIVGLVFLLTAAVGILFNGCIIIVFLKKRQKLLNPTTCFILALTCLDFFMSLVNMPMVIVSSFLGDWAFGIPGCIFYGFTMTFTGLTIIAILTMISFDQYIVMVKSHLKCKRTIRIAILACLMCFLWGLSWAVGPLVGWNSYVFTIEAVHTSCAVNWNSKKVSDLLFTMSLLVFCFLLPFSFVSFFYVNIYLKVKRSPRINTKSSNKKRQERRQKYIAKTIFFMLGAFLLSWCPYAIVVIWSAIGDSRDLPNLVVILPALFAKISVIWNPLIYAFRNRELKNSWKAIFHSDRETEAEPT